MIYDVKEGQVVWHKTLKESLKLTICGTYLCWAVRKDKDGQWDSWAREFAVHYSDLEVV